MKPSQVLVAKSSTGFVSKKEWRWSGCGHGYGYGYGRRFSEEFCISPGFSFQQVSMKKIVSSPTHSTVPYAVNMASHTGSGSSSSSSSSSGGKLIAMEEDIEKIIYGCRFLTILAVLGSLVGSFLCFIKGCTFVVASFLKYPVSRGKVILLLVEALDVYLLGTVMLVFGMGLYELFVCNFDIGKSLPKGSKLHNRSNLFGLFTLMERPKWLEIKSLNELKTKVGHVIVMILLIGLFEKTKKVVISSPVDLLCFSASILLSSCSLYLLSKLNSSKANGFQAIEVPKI